MAFKASGAEYFKKGADFFHDGFCIKKAQRFFRDRQLQIKGTKIFSVGFFRKKRYTKGT